MNLTQKNGFWPCVDCGSSRPEANLSPLGRCNDGWCERLKAEPGVVFRERMAEALGEGANPDSVDLLAVARLGTEARRKVDILEKKLQALLRVRRAEALE